MNLNSNLIDIPLGFVTHLYKRHWTVCTIFCCSIWPIILYFFLQMMETKLLQAGVSSVRKDNWKMWLNLELLLLSGTFSMKVGSSDSSIPKEREARLNLKLYRKRSLRRVMPRLRLFFITNFLEKAINQHKVCIEIVDLICSLLSWQRGINQWNSTTNDTFLTSSHA